MNLHFLDQFIKLLIEYKELAYLILFFGSMFETVIGFSFFIYGELFFLSGSILAGMGVLNIWAVIIILYSGGIIGDNISYILGKRYGTAFYTKLRKIKFINRVINKKNYHKGVKFFRKYGALSVFFGRLLGPLSWITPFVVGSYKLKYRKFLPYEIAGVVIGIGQFILVGYFFGRHFDTVLKLLYTYILVIIFLLVCLIFFYYYLKKRKLLSQFKNFLKEEKKKALYLVAKNSIIFTTLLIIIYLLFLLFIFFIDTPYQKDNFPTSYNISKISHIKNCKKYGLYYDSTKADIIQPINIIIKTKMSIKKILGKEWIQNEIFLQNSISFSKYIHLLQDKIPPVSSLLFLNLPQNLAFQYKSKYLSKREHIRIWNFIDKKSKIHRYYASISYDDGYKFSFYNYFITPVHSISKNIDKSRDFFYKYISKRKDLKIQCKYIQTKCKIKKLDKDTESADEQMFYTDGRILSCNITQRKIVI